MKDKGERTKNGCHVSRLREHVVAAILTRRPKVMRIVTPNQANESYLCAHAHASVGHGTGVRQEKKLRFVRAKARKSLFFRGQFMGNTNPRDELSAFAPQREQSANSANKKHRTRGVNKPSTTLSTSRQQTVNKRDENRRGRGGTQRD